MMKNGNSAPDLKGPEFVERKAQNALCISFTGSYHAIDFSGSWKKLWTFVRGKNLSWPGVEYLALYHDDPGVTPENQLRADVCLTVEKPAEVLGEIQAKTIAGGRYAKFLHKGPYEESGAVYYAIYKEWLPSSGKKLRPAPVMEKYLNDPAKTNAMDLLTEIYIPVE